VALDPVVGLEAKVVQRLRGEACSVSMSLTSYQLALTGPPDACRNFAMTIFFTADTHFSHASIIGFCDRPFRDTQDMDEALVANWNRRVGPDDTVFHLGDFCWRKGNGRSILAQLRGRKHLILGNHDSKEIAAADYWESVSHYQMIRREPGVHPDLVLFHYPIEEWDNVRHGAVHLHRHVHARLPPSRQRLDVGVDCWGFAPVSLEEVLAAAEALPVDDVALRLG
jgi:calcineurin-like phosphoesterase family protein